MVSFSKIKHSPPFNDSWDFTTADKLFNFMYCLFGFCQPLLVLRLGSFFARFKYLDKRNLTHTGLKELTNAGLEDVEIVNNGLLEELEDKVKGVMQRFNLLEDIRNAQNSAL